MKTSIELIQEERQRQLNVEGWKPEHDDEHTQGQLAKAAACYCLAEGLRTNEHQEREGLPILRYWPFHHTWWKPSPNDRIKELVKAGALIAAEIDRLQRKEKDVL